MLKLKSPLSPYVMSKVAKHPNDTTDTEGLNPRRPEEKFYSAARGTRPPFITDIRGRLICLHNVMPANPLIYNLLTQGKTPTPREGEGWPAFITHLVQIDRCLPNTAGVTSFTLRVVNNKRHERA